MTFKGRYGNVYIDEAYDKFFNKQKITYEEYVLILALNDEIDFLYHNKIYQIIHETEKIVSMCVYQFNDKQKMLVKSDSFINIIALLDTYRIDNKRIRDIWEEVSFN